MSSTFKLAATTAVLLTTISFTSTAGDTRYFVDMATKSYADTNEWSLDAHVRHRDDGEKRLFVEIGGLDIDDLYTPKGGSATELIDEDSCETDEEEPNLTVCETVTPFQIILTVDGTKFKYETSEVVFEDDPDQLCGGAEVGLRTDKGDFVPNAQPGDKVVVKLKKSVGSKIGNGKFSEDEPEPGAVPPGCPIEVEPEEG